MASEAIGRVRLVVAGQVGVDVRDRAQPRGRIQRACGDAYRVALRSVPEQARSALGTEPASRSRAGAWDGEPTQCILTGDRYVLTSRRRHGASVAVPPPAVVAVTDDHV